MTVVWIILERPGIGVRKAVCMQLRMIWKRLASLICALTS